MSQSVGQLDVGSFDNLLTVIYSVHTHAHTHAHTHTRTHAHTHTHIISAYVVHVVTGLEYQTVTTLLGYTIDIFVSSI